MLKISDLLSAAKRGAGIPSNYRLARVLGITDSGVQRWTSGRGVPDDAMAARMAQMAGLDPGYVVASVRALREKDDGVRAIWADMAERLLLTAGMPVRHDGGTPPTEGNDPESGVGEGGTGGGSGTVLSGPVQNAHYAQVTYRRQVRLALARALRQLRKSRAH